MKGEIRRIIEGLSLEEKAALCVGRDFWHTIGIERFDIPSIMMTDGPHGLRKMKENGDLAGRSHEATCFPTASCLAASWDRELLREVGEALGEECLQEGVGVLLGPGANIKRSPLCGRNFEYYSEDPYITGEMAASLIQGVQSKGIGTSLKHYAVNNQETLRMTIDAFVDERALREIYLAGFEKAVKQALPWTVMCSYNRVNGTYASENPVLLTDILRKEWQFQGIVVSDWGAVNERDTGLMAGLELEMPGPSLYNRDLIVEAVKSGRMDEAVLDDAVARLLELILKCKANSKPGYRFDKDAHHRLAVRAATEGAVLLKNDGPLLPLDKSKKVALIGEFAKLPRYQGAGSSLVNPLNLESAYDVAMASENHAMITYARGYDADSDEADQTLIDEACEAASSADVAIIMAGLPDAYESEGFDRDHMKMPPSHNELIMRVAKVNPNVVVVLCNGSPVEMPWVNDVKAILEAYLAGQGGGSALWKLLYGEVNPSGKLAETFPEKLEDCPATPYFPMGPTGVEYRESIYVGYRFYDKAGAKVLFPFGHGLSYTRFEYGGLRLDKERMTDSETLSVYFTVKNVGERAGSEIAQVYVRDTESSIFRPDKELKEFARISLEPGEEKEVMVTLDKRAFAYYNTALKDWQVETGAFEILVGASSRDIRLSARIEVVSSGDFDEKANDRRAELPGYYSPNPGWSIKKEEFERLYGKPVEHAPTGRRGTFTVNSTLAEVKRVLPGRIFYNIVIRITRKNVGNTGEKMLRMIMKSMDGTPLRQLVVYSGGKFSRRMVDGWILIFNGKFFKGIAKLITKEKRG